MASFPVTIKTFSSTGFVDLATTTLVRLQSIDVAARPQGILHPQGVIQPRRAAYGSANKSYTFRNLTSDLSGYRKLVETATYRTTVDVSANFPNVPANIPETIAIEEFATDVGVMKGIISNGLSPKQIDVEAFRDPLASENVAIILRVYKHSADGTQELLADYETGYITGAYAVYSFVPALLGNWSAYNDRLVVKVLGVNYGMTPPP